MSFYMFGFALLCLSFTPHPIITALSVGYFYIHRPALTTESLTVDKLSKKHSLVISLTTPRDPYIPPSPSNRVLLRVLHTLYFRVRVLSDPRVLPRLTPPRS